MNINLCKAVLDIVLDIEKTPLSRVHQHLQRGWQWDTYIGRDGETLSVWQRQQLVVVQHRVEILHPLRVNISVKYYPLQACHFVSSYGINTYIFALYYLMVIVYYYILHRHHTILCHIIMLLLQLYCKSFYIFIYRVQLLIKRHPFSIWQRKNSKKKLIQPII